MRAITTGELDQLRGDNQYAEVFVIPRVPNVIYSARLASVPSSTDMVFAISINNGTGTAANIRADMKVLVGTSAGGDELGFCRVRAVPSLVGGAGTLAVGLLSHIDWQANCYITITDDYDIFPRHSYWASGEQFVDYNVEYQDQHEAFEPIVNMGEHRVIVLSGGTASHQRTDASEVFDGTVSSRLWAAPNASSVTNSTSATATFNYTTAGHFCEYLTITTNDSKTFTGVRYVFVLPAYPTTSNIISFSQVETAADGVRMEFEMAQNAALTDFKHRAFVIAWARTYYQNTEAYISYKTGEENIIGCGRISSETLRWNDETGTVAFTAHNWKHWMERVPSFPFALTMATSAPTMWSEMTTLNIDRAVWALLHEYSTISRIADFYPSDDTRYANTLEAANNNLAAQLEEISLTRIYADLVFDRYGSGHLRVEPQLVPEADRAGWDVVQAITSADYVEELAAELNTYDEQAQMSLSAISVPLYGQESPHFALSYGRIYSPYGTPGIESDLIVEDQTHANTLAGLMMGWNNRKFDALTVRFVGMNMMFSTAEYCRASINITAGSNPRGFAYNGYLCPRAITYEWDAESNFISASVEFQDESVEKLSVVGDFPTDTDMDDDFSIAPLPKFTFPELPPIGVIPPSVLNPNHPKKVIIGTSTGVFFTENFDEASPTWRGMNAGLAATHITGAYKDIVRTPSGAFWMLTNVTVSSQNANLYYAAGLGAEWQLMANANELATSLNGSSANGFFTGIGVNKDEPDQVAISFNYQSRSRMIFGANGVIALGGLIVPSAPINTNRHIGILYRDGDLRLFCDYLNGDAYMLKLTGGGVFQSATLLQAASSTNLAAYPLADNYLVWGDVGRMIVSDSALVSVSTSAPVPFGSYLYGFAVSPTGTYILGNHASSPRTPYISTDSGTTFSSLAGTVPVGSDVWENCGDDNRFMFGGGTVLRLTTDRGTTYVDKNGNLSFVAGALYDVQAIRYIS